MMAVIAVKMEKEKLAQQMELSYLLGSGNTLFLSHVCKHQKISDIIRYSTSTPDISQIKYILVEYRSKELADAHRYHQCPKTQS